MITCREFAELLFDLTSGELAPEQVSHVELHLSQCGHCAAYEETYRVTINLTRKLPRASLPPPLAEKLRMILKSYQQQTHGDNA